MCVFALNLMVSSCIGLYLHWFNHFAHPKLEREMKGTGEMSCSVDGIERFKYRNFTAGGALRKDHEDRWGDLFYAHEPAAVLLII